MPPSEAGRLLESILRGHFLLALGGNLQRTKPHCPRILKRGSVGSVVWLFDLQTGHACPRTPIIGFVGTLVWLPGWVSHSDQRTPLSHRQFQSSQPDSALGLPDQHCVWPDLRHHSALCPHRRYNLGSRARHQAGSP